MKKIIRCKDCVFYRDKDNYYKYNYCAHNHGMSIPDPEDFCSHGTKKDPSLKPCPFCGSEALTRSVDGGCLPSFMDMEKQDEIISKTPYVTTCSLSCDECGAMVQGYAATDDLISDDLYNKAVEDCYQKWNRRTRNNGNS